MNILGLNFFHANAAASIFVDGKLVAAAEEERFSRVKFSAGIPLCSIGFCLTKAGLHFKDIDVITYARSPNTRVVKDQIHFRERIYKINSPYDQYRLNLKLINFKETLAQHFEIPVETLVFKLHEQDHHLSHMLSGFHYSPFDQALLVSCDAFGDFVSLKLGIGRGQKIELLQQAKFPHSVGLFYTMVTQFLGFPNYGDETKVMGLSTLGQPEYTDRLRSIIAYDHGSLSLNLEYFDHETGVGTSWSEQRPDISQLFNEHFEHLMGTPRHPNTPLDSRHQSIAASLQHLTEEIIFSMIEKLQRECPIRNLVLTGGLAYNSLLNSSILRETEVEAIYIPPAPGNSGLSIGSCLASLGLDAPRQETFHAFWGPEYSSAEIARLLKARGIKYQKLEDPISGTVDLLISGKNVAWFQGRMEFGPRALGNRSLLINPLAVDPHRIKQRDFLKPFGISILQDSVSTYFHNSHSSPFMSLMGQIRTKHRRVFENVLLNNYCRYQTVGPENPRLYNLLLSFREETGLPFLINTSLNPKNEPVVESPQLLLNHFMEMHLDSAVLEDLLVVNPTASPRIQKNTTRIRKNE